MEIARPVTPPHPITFSHSSYVTPKRSPKRIPTTPPPPPRKARVRSVDERSRTPDFTTFDLRTCVGRLPALDFTAPRFALAHIARVLHLLDGAATECTFRKCFRWLYPEGRLYLSALTPLGDFWQPVRAEFARRLALGARWPGYIPDIARYVGPMPAAPAAVHLFDERILRRELVAAGFVVEDVEWYTLPWDEAQVCCALIARCGP